jgi:hypothetical protein
VPLDTKGYAQFCATFRRAVMSHKPQLSNAGVTRELEAIWGDLGDEDKKVF